jgi:hypothetical protein
MEKRKCLQVFPGEKMNSDFKLFWKNMANFWGNRKKSWGGEKIRAGFNQPNGSRFSITS